MAENRCSMCGNTNTADAQVCANCGARLTPVRPPKKNTNTGKFTGGLSWLDAFREETQPADAAASAFGQGESSYEQEMSSFEQESSEFEAPTEPSADDDAPEWLQRIRDRNETEQPSAEDSDAEIRLDEGSLSLGGEAEDVPDWLRSLKEQDSTVAESAEEAGEIPSWQDAMQTWNTADDAGYAEESGGSAFEEEEPKVTEWFSRIIPGDEEKQEPAQSVDFEQEDAYTPAQTVNFEQEDTQPPRQTVQFQEESQGSAVFSPFESDEDEIAEESALPDDKEFLSEFKDYEVPSGFTEEDYAEAKGEEVQYEDWETRSANLYSVTESINTPTSEDVPSWLDESEGEEPESSAALHDDNAQSVLNWLEELDQKEGGKQKARYWMGEIDTGELPPEQSADARNKAPDKKAESVYDPFEEEKSTSVGETQFFTENELDDEYETPDKTPVNTMMFNQEESEKDIPDWLSDETEELPANETKPGGHTVGLSGLDDSALGMDLSEDEESPWEIGSFAHEEDEDQVPKTPIMTAQLSDLDEEDGEEEEELPPWMQSDSTEATEPRKQTPIMTAELTDLDDQDDTEEEFDAPWLQHDAIAQEPSVPKTPKMTAALPGLDDEDLGMDLDDDEIPPWLQQDQQDEQENIPKTPLMTAELDGFDDDEEDESLSWMQEPEFQSQGKKPSLMTAALTGETGEDLESEEIPPWMQDIEAADVQKTPSQPLMTAELPELSEESPEEELPPWMQDVEGADVQKTPSQPLMTAELPELSEESAEEELPSWMQDVDKTYDEQPSQPLMADLSDSDETAMAEEEALPWMQEGEEEAAPPPKSAPLMTAALTGLDEEDFDTEETPAWMQDVEEVAPPAKGTPTMTAALSGLDEDDFQTEETPAWMQDLEEIAPPPGTPVMTAALPDLDQNEPTLPPPSAPQPVESEDDEIPDWMRTVEETRQLGRVPGQPPSEPAFTEPPKAQKSPFTVGLTDDADEKEQSIDEMFSDDLFTTGKLNEMTGAPQGVQEIPAGKAEEEEQSIDEMFSDQLLTTGRLNAMSGVPDGVQESADDEQSIDELFSDQLQTTDKVNAVAPMPDGPKFESDEDESVDDMFSDQLFTTGVLNKLQAQDESDEGKSIDEAFSADLLNTGKLRDLSSGAEPTQALPAEDDWLADFEAAGSEDDDMLVGASVIDGEPKALPEPASDMPDWLSEFEPEDEEVHANEGPAFVFDEEPEKSAKLEESHPFAGDDLPNWLSPEVWQADGQPNGEKTPASSDAGVANIQWELEGLEKGEMPSWLQQIKPDQLVNKKKPTVTADQIEEQSEKVGPLAGLAGVLPAQDMVTVYRKPPVYSDQILLSERQSNRMQVLSRMIESEAKNKTLKVGVEKIPFNMMRMIFAVVLVIIMIIPLSGLIPITGGLPFAASDPVVAFFNQVENFPEGSSVLLVMDFESGYTAEMRSSLDGLMMRLYEKNIDVAMISTLPTGPVIAEQVAQDNWYQYYASHPEINVTDYETRVLNLGYLPGGSAAMLQFVRYPRQSVQYGFRYEKEPTNVWDTQVLSDVYNTNNFSGVVVITDSANISRNWIEQTTLYALDNILFITSAQAYPLILPYWQSGQVKGLIAGVYQGYTYRTLLGQSNGLESRWYSYQFGMNLITIVAIFLTIIYVIRNTLPRIRKPR